MKDKSLLGPWIRRFLLEHLVAERNLSRNTQASYRDTLTLLLPFASKQGGCAIDRMTVEELTPEVVRKFLDHLERDRQCSEVTRNQRLATIHSLARFIGTRSPVHLAWCDTGSALQEDGQDRDRIPRKGRDGRAAKPT
ncbi:site-specific recombinase XerD [Bradyrhizobium sp. LM2.7]